VAVKVNRELAVALVVGALIGEAVSLWVPNPWRQVLLAVFAVTAVTVTGYVALRRARERQVRG
jgi:uncharacterized membrane protein (DUF4010 family)